MAERRGTAVVTGAGRRRGIGAAIARGLARDGWDLAISHWTPYDERLGLARGSDDPSEIADECRELGSRVVTVPVDLARVEAAQELLDAASELGEVRGLVMSHCESVDSSILDTTLESWERHFAVNARAAWLLIRALAERLPAEPTTDARARIVALTSDHTTHNLPYGASKGALDRIVVAAGEELGSRGVRANVVNPGPVDTGWMTPEIRESGIAQTPAGRLGTPEEVADLVRFLLSDAGGWINGQLLYSNGGFRTHG